MSKSKGNVVTPDAMIDKYGADALRLWELFMGPFEKPTNWNEDGVVRHRALSHARVDVVRRYVEAGCPAGQSQRRNHQARPQNHPDRHRSYRAPALQHRARHDDGPAQLPRRSSTPDELGRFALESYVLMLAPMAPHVAEELWRALGHTTSIHLEAWPKFDPQSWRATRWSRSSCRSTARCATACRSPPARQKPRSARWP